MALAETFQEIIDSLPSDWADWDVEFGILEERPDVGAAFDNSLVGPTDRG